MAENMHVSALRMDNSLYGRLVTVAKREGRSVNQQVVHFVKKYLEELEGNALSSASQATAPPIPPALHPYDMIRTAVAEGPITSTMKTAIW